MNVLFVCSSDLASPSEKQVMWFCRELIRQGHRAMVSLGDDPETLEAERDLVPTGAELRWRRFRGRRIAAEDVAAARRFGPDVIHAFNSRVPVVAAARELARATGAPVFVHWEDDEWGLIGGLPTGSAARRAGRLARRAASRLFPAAWYFSTRASIRWATRHAAAFDAVAPAVAAYVRERTGRDATVVLPPLPGPGELPGAAAAPPLPASLERLPLVAYTGQVHPARLDDLRLGLEAVAQLQRQGTRVGYVHAGGATDGLDPRRLAEEAGVAPGTFAFLGHVPFAAVPPLLERAAVLLQAGHPTRFNVIGLPSKLQAYLASGTPTIVSAAGAGELLEDRREALKLERPRVAELARLIRLALEDRDLRQTLARGGPRAAARLFDAERNTRALVAHYEAHMDAKR